jgi:L-seryl-tRNA(Ser) seleniumtransferase
VPAPVFKTGDAALDAAWWVRLPCAPASSGVLDARAWGSRSAPVAVRVQADRAASCTMLPVPTRPPSKDRPSSSTARPPSVERVLAIARARVGDRDPAALAAVARAVIADERARLRRQPAPPIGDPARQRSVATPSRPEDLAAEVVRRIAALETDPGPPAVINATGVIVHTNLGRAVWPQAAIDAAARAASGTVLLELDAVTGRRGSRFRAAEDHLVAITGAEDGLVVNNAAAALALAVGLSGRRGIAVARGELVEIGGGVRIPDVVRRAGARLVEVGTTNRTRVEDFREPLEGGRVGLVLRVHPSNFIQEGFVESPDLADLATVAHAHGVMVVDDLGSGALLDTAGFGLAHEPMPSERLAAGADLVLFSGDKLVGGPQAGLIVGRRDPIRRLRRDPLARAVRPDKVTLAAVAATLALYLAGTAARAIPVWRAISAEAGGLRERAEAIRATIGPAADVVPTESTIGGGSLPGQVLPSWGLAVRSRSPDRLAASLRTGHPAVVGRIDDDRVVLDLRTVGPTEDALMAAALLAGLAVAGGDR